MRDKIVQTIIGIIITLIVNAAVTYFSVDKGIVRIGNQIEVDNGRYEVPISITNFSENNFDKIRIRVPSNIEIKDIKTDQTINISKIENNIGNEKESVFEISRVAEKQQIHIIIYLKERIDAKNIAIEKNGYKIGTEYFNDIKSPLEKQITYALIDILIYGICFVCLAYFTIKEIAKSNKDRDENLKRFAEERDERLKRFAEERDENIKRIREECDDKIEYAEKAKKAIHEICDRSEIEIRRMESDIKEVKDYNSKRELLLMSRISDYKKELDFWKDTIRKIIYTSKDKKIDTEAIFDNVTDTLKTYQTKAKDYNNIDTIKILANIIKANEDKY